MKKLFVLLPLLALVACADPSPQAQAAKAEKMKERNDLFLHCIDLAARNPTYHNNSDVVDSCRQAAQMLI